jgi:hypothetical protein
MVERNNWKDIWTGFLSWENVFVYFVRGTRFSKAEIINLINQLDSAPGQLFLEWMVGVLEHDF